MRGIKSEQQIKGKKELIDISGKCEKNLASPNIKIQERLNR